MVTNLTNPDKLPVTVAVAVADPVEVVVLDEFDETPVSSTRGSGHVGAVSTWPKLEAAQRTTPFVQPKPACGARGREVD